MLSNEELIKIGVNPDNLTYPFGEMNIIVQSHSVDPDDFEEGEEIVFDKASPDIYQPRKNRVWSCGCSGDDVELETEEDKKDWVKHLRDSAERLKIMSYYLMKQADEIEEFGYPKTNCYYPE